VSKVSILGGGAAEEPLEPEIKAAIDAYRPRTPDAAERWPRLAELTQRLVAASRPSSPIVARVWMWRVVALLTWAEDMGLPLDPGVLFAPAVVDRFCAMRATERERSGTRSHLRQIGRVVAPDRWPAPDPVFSRRSYVAPYSAEEIDELFQAAGLLSTSLLRKFLRNLLVLGLGCGVVGAEAIEVVGDDVHMNETTVVVSVNGRVVPCRWEYEEALWKAAKAVGAQHLVGPRLDRRIDVVREQFRKAGCEVALSSNRLRLTWLVRQLSDVVPVHVILKGAGLTSAHPFDRCLPFLPEVEDDSYLRWLRGDAR
jgi:hypothetical protein